MPNSQDPEMSFAASVPSEMQDDVLQRIEECAWGFMTDPDIEITDLERRNVLNIEYTGVIRIGGIEHRFHIRSGDAAGTEILSWDGETDINREARVETTLVPTNAMIWEAIHLGRAAKLLDTWDAALDPSTASGRALHRLPQAAAYDAYFAPGSGASRTHHDTAHKAGYEIVEKETAIARRGELLTDALPLVPVASEDDPLQILQDWDAALAGSTVAGHRTLMLRTQILSAVAARGGRAPDAGEEAWMRETGFAFETPTSALRRRAELTRQLVTAEPIAGFDPASLPESPIAVLFNRLDPALAPDVRVNPEVEMERILEALGFTMARERRLEIPEVFLSRAAELGYRLECRKSLDFQGEEISPSL